MTPATAAPGEAERLQALRDFGLSDYTSRVYLALVELGRADARTISQEARIPAAKIYGTLNQLMEKNLARLLVGKPRQYEPVPFAEFIEHRKDAFLEQAERLTESAPRLVAMFELQKKRPGSDRGSIEILRGRLPIVRRQRQMAAEAETDLLVVPSKGAASRPQTLVAIVNEASVRGLKPRILVAKGTLGGEAKRSIMTIADVRLYAPSSNFPDGVTYTVFDGERAIIAHHVPDDGNPERGQDIAFQITQPAIARSLLELLDVRWHAAPAPSRERKQR